VLLHHVAEEEDDLLPRFAAAEGVTSDYLMQLGRLWETSKLHLPSRCAASWGSLTASLKDSVGTTMSDTSQKAGFAACG
jgi:hypothetical protein